jgi:DNA-directed RNA polymerase specialized sigma24 family protein
MESDDDQRYQRLLAWLGPDKASSSLRLEQMRRQLTMFFAQRGLHEDAEDLAQNVLMTILNKCSGPDLPSYGLPEQLMTGIARNVLLRRWSAPKVIQEGVESIDAGRRIFSRPEISDSAEKRCLDRALLELPASDRRVFEEYFTSDEWERADLANRLGVTTTALRTRACRAKKALLAKIRLCLQKRQR